ncbi:MAG: DUF362 domain-containing protein [Lachnospiraceae bacterium]
MKKNEIAVIYGKEYKNMTKELLEFCRLEEMIPAKDVCIGIKPNLVSAVPAEEGATTHPEVIEGLILYLKEKGFTNLVILEGSWVGDQTSDAFAVCGYEALSEKYQVPLWDMQKDKSIEKDCRGLKLHICERVSKIDFLINVPVLKGHCQTRMTCALKNMKGLIPNSEKRRFHRMGLHRPIGLLSSGIHQDFILVDSICGDLTFEDGGNPVEQNRLMAAVDPVLCDTFGCTLIGIHPQDVEYIAYAQQAGVGSNDLEQAQIHYLHKEEEMPYFHASGKALQLAERVEEVESCSACYGYLIPALHMLEEEGLLEQLKEKVCIGQGYRGKTGVLGIGNCTRKFTHHLPGCPPTEMQIYEFLKEYLQSGEAGE